MPFNLTDIEWCTHSWGPVSGCLHGCPYCYARAQVRRFAGRYYEGVGVQHRGYREEGPGQLICDEDVQYLYDPKRSEDGGIFIAQPQPHFMLDAPLPYQTKAGKMISAPYPFGFCPTFHAYRLEDPVRHKQPARVFVGSMCDLFGPWVPDEWIERVFAACEAAPQHTYMFLTKNPARYLELEENGLLPDKGNMWYGSTVTGPDMQSAWSKRHNTFVSVEPLLAPILLEDQPWHALPDWIIIGAMTGPGAKKKQPEREWVRWIVQDADMKGIPVFMKESLLPIMGEAGMRREYPPEMAL